MKSYKTAIVIIPFHSDNIQFLDKEIERLNVRAKSVQPFRRLVKNGYINGRLTTFLVIQLAYGCMINTSIQGLKYWYLMYVDFIGAEIKISAWERIRIDDKEEQPFFDKLLLTDYSQDPNFEWGCFKCKLILLNLRI